MCWQCSYPDATREDYLAYLKEMVDCHGWAVQGVERSGSHPPWAYTVGLTQRGRSELVVTGMPLSKAEDLLNGLAAHELHADETPPGLQGQIPGGPFVEYIAVRDPAEHLVIAAEFYGPRVRALQIVHADDRGHWPWDVGYRGVRGGQPVLGRRMPPERRKLIA